MHKEEPDEDEPEPGEVVATTGEVWQAAEAAMKDKVLKARLLRAAYVLLRPTKVLKKTCSPEDLMGESLDALLRGRRKWRTNKVDFPGLLIGVMKSLAWSRDKTMTTTMP